MSYGCSWRRKWSGAVDACSSERCPTPSNWSRASAPRRARCWSTTRSPAPQALAADRRLDVDPCELGGIADGVDAADPPLLDHEADCRVEAVVGAHDPGADRAVEQHRQDL